MQDDNIYTLTPQGEKELHGGMTSLLPEEVELLVRIDGVLTFGQIKSGMPTVPADALSITLRGLLNRRLLKLAEIDPFANQFQIQLDKMALSLAGPEADSCTQSLKKAGYYVSIARKRGPVRKLAPGETLTAVVVDDELMLAKFIESYLSFEGFHVRMAGNREQILAELRKPPVPDLILLDVMMPDADGFQILLKLRQHPAFKQVPIIMLTGKATREDVLKGLAGGADGYITKPFEADVLMRAVRAVVGLPDSPAVSFNSNDPWINKDAAP